MDRLAPRGEHPKIRPMAGGENLNFVIFLINISGSTRDISTKIPKNTKISIWYKNTKFLVLLRIQFNDMTTSWIGISICDTLFVNKIFVERIKPGCSIRNFWSNNQVFPPRRNYFAVFSLHRNRFRHMYLCTKITEFGIWWKNRRGRCRWFSKRVLWTYQNMKNAIKYDVRYWDIDEILKLGIVFTVGI